VNTKSQQAEKAEQTSVQPEPTRTRATRQHTGRTAMAIVTIAIGGALTALVIGVSGGTDAEAPPSPGFSPPYGNELPPKELDQHLHNLGPERYEVPPKGLDQHLYNLAEEWAARQRAQQD
jgi:hypothetical protein